MVFIGLSSPNGLKSGQWNIRMYSTQNSPNPILPSWISRLLQDTKKLQADTFELWLLVCNPHQCFSYNVAMTMSCLPSRSSPLRYLVCSPFPVMGGKHLWINVLVRRLPHWWRHWYIAPQYGLNNGKALSMDWRLKFHEFPIDLMSGWWFGTFFIFLYIGNNHPNWLIFFRGVGIPRCLGSDYVASVQTFREGSHHLSGHRLPTGS